MHAMNLIDGLDGLAAGVAFFATATVFVTAVLFGNHGAGAVSIMLAGAVLGFLVFNFHPASVYLGDSGSYLLGFLIACIGLRGAQKTNMVIGLLIPVIALGLPVMDMALSMLRRWCRALPLSASDRQHIHHKLLDMGFTHRQTVLIMYGGCTVLAGFALLMTAAANLAAAGLLLLLALATFLTVRLIGRAETQLVKSRLTDYLQQRRCGRECRTAGYAALEIMQHASTVASVWDVFSTAADKMELDHAAMNVRLSGNPREKLGLDLAWTRKRSARYVDGSDAVCLVTLPLMSNGVKLGELRVFKTTNGTPLGRALPEMLELLSGGLASNIRRVHLSGPPTRDLHQRPSPNVKRRKNPGEPRAQDLEFVVR